MPYIMGGRGAGCTLVRRFARYATLRLHLGRILGSGCRPMAGPRPRPRPRSRAGPPPSGIHAALVIGGGVPEGVRTTSGYVVGGPRGLRLVGAVGPGGFRRIHAKYSRQIVPEKRGVQSLGAYVSRSAPALILKKNIYIYMVGYLG